MFDFGHSMLGEDNSTSNAQGIETPPRHTKLQPAWVLTNPPSADKINVKNMAVDWKINCTIVIPGCMFITQNVYVTNTEVELQSKREGEGSFTVNM